MGDINTEGFSKKVSTGKTTWMKMSSTERWNKFQVSLSERMFKKTTFSFKIAHMANQEDCKKIRTWRQKYHNLKTVFLCFVFITILAAICAVHDGDSDYLKTVDQTERKGIGKHRYNLQQMWEYASHALNSLPKQFPDSWSTWLFNLMGKESEVVNSTMVQ